MFVGPASQKNLSRIAADLTSRTLCHSSPLPHRSRKLVRTFFQQAKKKSKPEQHKVRLHQKIRDTVLVLEAKQGPVGKTVVGIGQGIVTAGLVFGSGSLFYHTLFDQDGGEASPPVSSSGGGLYAPEFISDRINTAYMYMFNSLGISTLGAAASFRFFRNPVFLNVVSAQPLLAIGLALASQFALTMLVRSLPYREGFGAKQAGSVAQALLVGLSAAPLYLLGAQSIIRAGFVTAGLVAGLTGVSTILPHDALATWEIPLRIGMCTVFLSFMALWFLPRRHFSYNLLYRVAMQGGLVVFPAYYLFNAKAMVRSATYSPHFDPINSSMSLYTDVLNIYGRLAFLLPPHYFISGDTRRMGWTTRPGDFKK